MKAGRNPTRRNRNIGTPARGHGKDNRLVIPFRMRPEFRLFFENLQNYSVVLREAHGQQFRFLVERTRVGYRHHCTVDDVMRM